MLETGPVPRSRQSQASQRAIAIVLAFVALAGLVSGLVGRQLLVDQDPAGTMQCGLRACEATYGDETITTTTHALVEDIRAGGGKASAAWSWSGTIAWFATMVAMAGVGAALGMVMSRKYVRFPIMSPTTIALLGGAAALIGGCIFVATKPESIAVTRIGWTFWTFGAGTVCAIIGAVFLSRQLALLEPEFDPGESPEAPPDEPWQDP